MTMDSSAWAINGPTISAALARRAMYAEARQEGIVHKGDLKVAALDVPGVGVQISDGVGLVLNRYQTNPNEMYVVSNSGSHTIPSEEMPAANPVAKSYLVAIVIGDPDFSQVGHPWMTASDPPAGEQSTFEYVRPTLIEVAAGTKTAAGLGYPALALARLDVPADTTTITNDMIIDLRSLANSRSDQQIFVSPANTWNSTSPKYIATGETLADWTSPDYLPTVVIPTWATRAIMVATINGTQVRDTSQNVWGAIRPQIGGVLGAQTAFDFPAQVGSVRANLQTAHEFNVSSIAGQTASMRIEGYQTAPASPTNNQRLSLRFGTEVIFDLRFFEE